mgnify:CR=1 FL=1
MTSDAKYAVEAFTQFANSLDDAGMTFDQLVNAVVNNQPEEEKPWPQVGDRYFIINLKGEVMSLTWEGWDFDKNAKEQGIYRTKEQAQQIAQNRKVHTMLKELAGGFEPDWSDDDEQKHFLYWDFGLGKVDVDYIRKWQIPNILYFESRTDVYEAIQAVTEKHGQDAIKKYCLDGVI